MTKLRLAFRPAQFGYALAAIALFLIEVYIALRVHDRIIRPYGGDVLAVVFVYLCLRAVTTLRVMPAACLAFGIGLAVELLQGMHALHYLGLQHNRLARIVLGASFDVADIGCYALGAALAVLGEYMLKSFHR